MDAKPQRPLRALRVQDENMPPVVAGYKTIHHRNKSSPALSTAANGGVLQGAVRRTAFRDVSNTLQANRPVRDDLSISTKQGYEVNEKQHVMALNEGKSTVFLRPAQRPLSVFGLKSLLNNVTNTTARPPPASKPGLVEPSIPVANICKALTKRSSTAVFKDSASAPVQVEKPAPNLCKSLPVSIPAAPAPREIGTRQHQYYMQEPKPAPIKVHRTQHDYAPIASKIDHEHRSTHSSTSTLVEENVYRSDGVYIDEKGYLRSYEYVEEREQPVPVASSTDKENQGGVLLEEVKQASTANHNTLSYISRTNAPQRSTTIEPEEYWDDEEDDELYEEDEGFVTARSCKSRGDNTTGGATTILFPKINPKIKNELATAKVLTEERKTYQELEDEAFDTSMVAEYGEEIFSYMKELEIKMLPNAHYMDNQAEIQWSMRSVLMDWIVQVHHRFGLLPETLFLTVNYIDRFLSCKIVSLGKLQLVGATAIFVAAKYEEINCPSIQEIVFMVDGGYTADEILKAERFMLSMLQFELGWPGPMSFLRRISKADDYDLETRTLAKYFLEITIMDERFIGCPPSFTAAGAHCLSRMMLQKGGGFWSPAHVYYSNYTYSQIHPLIHLMLECCEIPQKHHGGVYDKYCDQRFKRAAIYVENNVRRGFRLIDVADHDAATTATVSYMQQEDEFASRKDSLRHP